MAIASHESPYQDHSPLAPKSGSLLSKIMDKFDRYFDKREQRETGDDIEKVTEKLLKDRRQAGQKEWAENIATAIEYSQEITPHIFQELRKKEAGDWLAVLEKLPEKQKYIDQYTALIQLEKQNKRE